MIGPARLAVLAVACAGSLSTLAAAPAVAATVPVAQPLVVLLHDRVARIAPDAGARRLVTVAGRRPLTNVRTVLPVLDTSVGAGATTWLRVGLPGRPNGRTGWIPSTQTRTTSTELHIAVDLSLRRVTVYRDGRVERRFAAIVGRPATPTPTGTFFIEEALALAPQDAGGPFALATSARSAVLQDFAGGPGQIALHGMNNLTGAAGSAISHGCVRLGTRAITWLARRIGAGVPLTITR